MALVNLNTHPMPRRSFLSMGALGISGLSLSQVFRLRAEAAEANGKPSTPPDTSVIFVWLAGGAPHMETYDMKPDAPEEYRGAFKPIPTNVPGIDVCELLPLHAKCADKYTLIRSIAHKFSDHGGGSKRFMTGRIPKTPTEMVNDAPSVISIVNKMRENIEIGMPNCMSLTDASRNRVDTYAMGSAYLGPKYTPFIVGGDQNSSKFEVQNVSLSPSIASRLDDRLLLLKGFDRLRNNIDASGMMDSVDKFNQQALSLMTSPKARDAFDLSKEPQALRDRYGKHAWGQRALMARRLVEAGCSFVTVVLENPGVKDTYFNWDSHAVNTDIFKDARLRLPIYDQTVTALVEDLHARGLTKKVMLVVAGEFGRGPKLEYSNGRPGRGHWPQANSALVCGGGMRHGQVVGSTNARGEYPKDRPLTPDDLWATVYRHLGIDQNATIDDHSGRPQYLLPSGEPIRELI